MFYSTLTEAQLGELYIWLEQTFPIRLNPHGQWVGPRDNVAHLRDGVLRYLVNTGTEAGVQIMREVVRQLADRERLVYQLLEAEQVMRTKTWSPLFTREVVRVTGSSRGLL